MAWRGLVFLALGAACGDAEEAAPGRCADAPDEPSDMPTVLSGQQDCGYWVVPEGESVLLNLLVNEELPACDPVISGPLEMPYDPIYSNLGDDGPKYTFQLETTGTGEAELEIECDEGSEWWGRFRVE